MAYCGIAQIKNGDVKRSYDNNKVEEGVNLKSKVNFRRICAVSHYRQMSRLRVVTNFGESERAKYTRTRETRRSHGGLLACRVVRAFFSFSELVTKKKNYFQEDSYKNVAISRCFAF